MSRFLNLATAIAISTLATGTLETAWSAVKSQTIAYKQDTASLEGMLVRETSLKGKQPGIVLVPDWMGMSDQAKAYAERVAKLGYIVFVADIYGKATRPKDMKEAATVSGIYKNDRNLMQARVRSAYDQLIKSPNVDAGRVAAMGYCFGGGVALELARSGAPLNGVVSIHGNLDTPHPEQAKNIKGEVLVLHGADDPFVTEDQVKAFTEEMRSAAVDWRLTKFGGAVHAFTNPSAGSDNSKGMAYNAKADKRSFQEMADFYQEVFAAKSAGTPR
ncbi:MAG: dienelactone hydrolase-like enzyme [Fibrobacteres bacterium]|nr:dienelactone hydrolase-like enzyme [Fibrobacterota bacterium]